MDGEFALTTRWGAHNTAPHEWLVVRKGAASGRALLFDPTAKQYWQDLRGRPERFRRSRYRSKSYDKIAFEHADDFYDRFGG